MKLAIMFAIIIGAALVLLAASLVRSGRKISLSFLVGVIFGVTAATVPFIWDLNTDVLFDKFGDWPMVILPIMEIALPAIWVTFLAIGIATKIKIPFPRITRKEKTAAPVEAAMPNG